jgi:hypothetical protein
LRGGEPYRVLRAVNEAQEVALVEVAKSLHFFHDADGVAESIAEDPQKLKAEVESLRSHVEEEIARGRRRVVAITAESLEDAKFTRDGTGVEARPQVGANARHDVEGVLGCSKAHRALHSLEVREYLAHPLLGAALDGEHEKDG